MNAMKRLVKWLTERLHNNALSLKGRLSRVKVPTKTADSFLITTYYESCVRSGDGAVEAAQTASGPVAEGLQDWQFAALVHQAAEAEWRKNPSDTALYQRCNELCDQVVRLTS